MMTPAGAWRTVSTPLEILIQVTSLGEDPSTIKAGDSTSSEEVVACTRVLEGWLEVKSGCNRNSSAIPQSSKDSAVFFARVFTRKGIFRTNFSSTSNREELERSLTESRSVISIPSSSNTSLVSKSCMCLPYVKEHPPLDVKIAYNNLERSIENQTRMSQAKTVLEGDYIHGFRKSKE